MAHMICMSILAMAAVVSVVLLLTDPKLKDQSLPSDWKQEFRRKGD
jgi:hypothetical protein